ncbi:MAG: hypothetical protein UT24_C0016G0031 [Candidatus Woesebacteria bacterium GW2011_GWB1_39_12]|uniref:Uncharacterized protein n=1 Tax=Candidatus Woesebacteria bacterium GW2011_GWB1_39_12 TaxID=1618574 RepID=A0A0G0QEL4_9BACT|nr:MAG: hypothetical protein UT24_C0016G0031 [Candidatus Woesebacteria bacterium GW2011_GWB1_39_12]
MEEPKNSATFSMTTLGGFNVLFTIREGDIKATKDLVSLVVAVDKHFTEVGFKPQVKSFGGGFPKKEKEYTGDICPKDSGRLYHMVTKTGKDMCKCENSKYDFTTKTSSGCDFIAWGKNLEDAKVQKAKWNASKTVTAFEADNPNF